MRIAGGRLCPLCGLEATQSERKAAAMPGGDREPDGHGRRSFGHVGSVRAWAQAAGWLETREAKTTMLLS